MAMRCHVLLLAAVLALGAPAFGAELIFQSGFEADSVLVRTGNQNRHFDIEGIDRSVPAPNDWVKDLDERPVIGNFMIQCSPGTDADRFAEIVADPTNPNNHVLHFASARASERTPWGGKTRVQANLYGNEELGPEFTYRVRMYIHPDFNKLQTMPEKMDWMTIAEFWNNRGWSDGKFPFRITLGLHKTGTGEVENLFFGADGQEIAVDENGVPIVDNAWKARAWREVSPVAVPVGRWFEMEVYMKEGDAMNGRYVLTIQEEGKERQTVLDVTGYTHHPKATSFDGIMEINPMKLYCSHTPVDHIRENGGLLQFYWDDFKFWKGDARLKAAATKPTAPESE
jgi:hypothetical protein